MPLSPEQLGSEIASLVDFTSNEWKVTKLLKDNKNIIPAFTSDRAPLLCARFLGEEGVPTLLKWRYTVTNLMSYLISEALRSLTEKNLNSFVHSTSTLHHVKSLFFNLLRHPSFDPWAVNNEHSNLFQMISSITNEFLPKLISSSTALTTRLKDSEPHTTLTGVCVLLLLQFISSLNPFDPKINILPGPFCHLLGYLHPILFPEIKGAVYKSGIKYGSVEEKNLRAVLIPLIAESKLFGEKYAQNVTLSKQYHLAGLVYKDPTPAYIEIAKQLLASGSYKNNPDDLQLLRICCANLTDFTPLKSYLNDYDTFIAVNNCLVWLIYSDAKPTKNIEGLIEFETEDDLKFFGLAKWWLTSDRNKATDTTHFKKLLACLNLQKLFYYSDTDFQSRKNHLPISQIAVELFFYCFMTIVTKRNVSSKTHLADCKDILKAGALQFPILYWLLYRLYKSGILKGTGIGRNQESYVKEFFNLHVSYLRNTNLSDYFYYEPTGFKGNESSYPLIAEALSLKKQNPLGGETISYRAELDSAFSDKPYNDDRTIKPFEISFLSYLEKFIFLNLKAFTIRAEAVVPFYPKLNDVAYRAALQHDLDNPKNECFLGRENGSLYKSTSEATTLYPDLAIDLNELTRRLIASAPPMSRGVTPAQSRSASPTRAPQSLFFAGNDDDNDAHLFQFPEFNDLKSVEEKFKFVKNELTNLGRILVQDANNLKITDSSSTERFNAIQKKMQQLVPWLSALENQLKATAPTPAQ